jgi:hypothetical protein
LKVKILAPYWGSEHLSLVDFGSKIINAGYDGIDTWLPTEKADKHQLFDFVQKNELHLVVQQCEAEGDTFKKFKESFLKSLNLCLEASPVLINSHTGRDFFTFEQNLELIDAAAEVSYKSGVIIAHETHRGRFGFSPGITAEYFKQRPDFAITADFSHWVCVSESFLEGFEKTLQEAILRARHIHSRVGFEQGPQIPDPRAPEWEYAVSAFLSWWDQIIENNQRIGREIMTITTEFGPVPYMPTIPYSQVPVASQFDVNCYMMELLKARYFSTSN